jgi:2-oxoisovalerate ferredoxin oxidoreductase beta subunit
LNVFRDRRPQIPAQAKPPQRRIAEVLGIAATEEGSAAQAPSACRHNFDHLGMKIAGFGGQGVLLLGQLIMEMGMSEGLEVSWLPSYGPEMRSGSAHCHVCLSTERIGSPLVARPNVLVAMNEVSLRKFAPEVPENGIILYNGASLPPDFAVPEAQILCIPASEIADSTGSAKAANIVMLGAILEHTNCLGQETAMKVLDEKVRKIDLLEIDRRALAAGRSYIEHHANVGAVSQPDGFA